MPVSSVLFQCKYKHARNKPTRLAQPQHSIQGARVSGDVGGFDSFAVRSLEYWPSDDSWCTCGHNGLVLGSTREVFVSIDRLVCTGQQFEDLERPW